MTQTLSVSDLTKQDFKVTSILASSTKDKKRLELVAEAKYNFKPHYYTYQNTQKVGGWSDLSLAIAHYNNI